MNTDFNVIKLKYTFKVKFYLPIIPNETALIKNLVNAKHTQKMMFSKQAQTKLQKKNVKIWLNQGYPLDNPKWHRHKKMITIESNSKKKRYK